MLILVLLGQKVNTASTNINAATLALVMLEGNSVFLITIEIFKALNSFIDRQHATSVVVDAGGLATTKIRLRCRSGLSQTKLTDLVLKLSKKVEGLETKLKNTKQIYGEFQIVIHDDEADLPAEDSSKQGRMIEEIDLDDDTSLVQPHAA
ncbi:hypothetical protein Tco_0092404 [Tanacetum coccineum]